MIVYYWKSGSRSRLRAEGYVLISVHEAQVIYNGISILIYTGNLSPQTRMHLVEDLFITLHQKRLDK